MTLPPTPLPTMYISPVITYGDYAWTAAFTCLVLIVFVLAITMITIDLLSRRGKG